MHGDKYLRQYRRLAIIMCILVGCTNVQSQQTKTSQTIKERIIGKWRIDPKDEKAIELSGNISFEFKKSGELIYTIADPDKKSIINMTYKIEGNKIITDQPSAPRKQETPFKLKGDTLELIFADQKGRFLRVK